MIWTQNYEKWLVDVDELVKKWLMPPAAETNNNVDIYSEKIVLMYQPFL